MTDITELAQSLKEAAEKAGADYWQAKKISGDFYVIRKGSYKRECGYTTYQPIAEIDHKPTRDYMAMASPANILALVEALEAKGAECHRLSDDLRGATANVTLLKIDLRETHAESDAKDVLIAELKEALEKAQQRSGELEAYSKTTLEFREAARDENRHLKLELEIADKRISDLEEIHDQVIQSRDQYKRMSEEGLQHLSESRTVTVKLPPELYAIGENIRTQDNRITDQPMFVVFQKREIIVSDDHSPSRICWVCDGEEVSELRAKRLEALYQDGRETRGYDRYAMQEVDDFVTACFTEYGCRDFLRQNGHNLRLPYIYACGSFRNNEYQLVRNWLAGIKWEAE